MLSLAQGEAPERIRRLIFFKITYMYALLKNSGDPDQLASLDTSWSISARLNPGIRNVHSAFIRAWVLSDVGVMLIWSKGDNLFTTLKTATLFLLHFIVVTFAITRTLCISYFQ